MKTVVKGEKCYICGVDNTKFLIRDKATLLREARCVCCGATLRNSDLAEEICLSLLGKSEALAECVSELAGYRILNTCSSGVIHDALKELPGYVCCEYFDDVPNGRYKGNVLCVDLMDIPLEDDSFDLVISEDVFEHIADYPKALKEIRRILAPGGFHIFTVPVHEGKRTKPRTELTKKVWHGDPIRKEGVIVYTDFGSDLVHILKKYGYNSKCLIKHRFYLENEITDADASYNEYLSKLDCMDEYFKYNSLVFISQKKKLFDYFRNSIPAKSAELRARYFEEQSRSLFNASLDYESPKGCYQIEDGEGGRYAWASNRCEILLKLDKEASIIVIKGYVNTDIFRPKGCEGISLSVYMGNDISENYTENYTENGEVQISLPISTACREFGYIRVVVKSSMFICPKEEGLGDDERRLSWILKEIKPI